MGSTIRNIADSVDVDKGQRAERPSRCPEDDVRPRLPTTSRRVHPEPHPGFRPRRAAERGAPSSSSFAHRVRRGATALLLVVAGLCAVSMGAHAQTLVPNDWKMVPKGLRAGDEFRLIFATQAEVNATSTSIDHYNSIVQGSAAAGRNEIRKYASGFRVVGCTADDDARDNTSTTYTSSDKGVPIWWVHNFTIYNIGPDKYRVADDYEDFYDASWVDEARPQNELGQGRNLSYGSNGPFTGCNHDGTAASGRELGSSGQVRVGRPDSGDSDDGPIGSDDTTARTNSRPIYALSEVFRVGGAPRVCTAPDIRGRTEVWRATLTIEELILGNFSFGWGYHPIHGGALSPASFELDSRTVTIEGLANSSSFESGTIEIEFDVDIDKLPTLPSLRFHFCNRTEDISDATHNVNRLLWPAAFTEWATTTSIEVALSGPFKSPATGKPSIEGAPWEGRTLTAEAGTMADINGLPATPFPKGYSFQWVRVDGNKERDISGATSRTYTPVAADVGKRLKVEVTFKDRGGFGGTRETLASRAVGPVLALDETPPVPERAVVPLTGSKVNLTFNEDLDIDEFGPFPPTDAFTVKADGVMVAVQSVAGIALNRLALDLPTGAIGQQQIVTVSYAVPGTNPLRDAAENKATAFTDFPVTNNSTVANTTPPVPASGEVQSAGNVIALTFNEDLDIGPGKLPPASAFTVKADGAEVAVESVLLALGLDKLNLALPTGVTIGQNQIVTVSYAVPATNPLQDADGNETVAFTDFPVTNGSTVDNTTPPYPASAMVPASGERITLVFNKDLGLASDRLPAARPFTVKASGDEVAVDSVALGAGTDSVILNLPDDAIGQGLTVTVSYDRDRAGTNPIRDTDGRAAAAFDDFPVANYSTVEQPNNAPVFPSGTREFNLAENKPKGTTIGRVTATDADRDTLTYSLAETMESSWFTIGARSGQLRNNRDTVDFESVATNPVVVQVVARDARGGTARVDVKVRIRDVKEPPLAPKAPRDAKVRNDDTALRMTWGAPDNTGRPDIVRYDLRYRESGGVGWTQYGGTLDGNARSATIENLTQGTEYEVQVRAANADGNGAWSLSGQGTPELVTALTGDLRLVTDDGDTLSTNGAGRLEIFRRDKWGTVCDDQFSKYKGPEVACRQLEYETGTEVARARLGMSLAPRSKPIWLDDVRCTGTEDNLTQCSNLGWAVHNCASNHSEDVHLECGPASADRPDVTAELVDVPGNHTGAKFKFRVQFSEPIVTSQTSLFGTGAQARNKSYGMVVHGAYAVDVGRVDNRRDLWSVTVTPLPGTNIRIAMPAYSSCGPAHIPCTRDGRPSTTEIDLDVVLGAPLTARFRDHKIVSGIESVQITFSEDITREFLNAHKSGIFKATNTLTRSVGINLGDNDFVLFITRPGVDPKTVVVTVKGNTPCSEQGAPCTPDGRRLSETLTIELPVIGGQVQEPTDEDNDPLTAEFVGVPATHDGTTPFNFQVDFSADIENTAADMRNAFEVTGGGVTDAAKVDDRDDLWEIEITPEGDANVTILLKTNLTCGTPGAVCTGDGRTLGTTPFTSVGANIPRGIEEPEEPPKLTAQFENVPDEHDGTNDIRVDLMFSEEVFNGDETIDKNRAVRDAIGITGGTVLGSRRTVKTSYDAYRITVRPDGAEQITLVLNPPTGECTASSALCTPDGRKLSKAVSTTITGPAVVTVKGDTVQEAPDAQLEFGVKLSREAAHRVTIDYATEDGEATAGSDYTQTSGTLTFEPGETKKTVVVPVLDDSHDEENETMTLRLSNASGAYIEGGEATATGTIENSDHMPAAWLSRFGRTVADQMIEAAKVRFSGAPVAGTSLTIAGHTLNRNGDLDALDAQESTFTERDVTGRDLMTGTSFSVATGTAEGGTAGVWGRGALSSFSGTEEDLSLDGEVFSTMLGADLRRGTWTAGLLLAHTRATGSYRGADEGRVESELTGLYPYGQHAFTSRLSLWGVAGYGTGTLSLTPDGQPSLETDIDLTMAALGLRSVLVEAPTEGGPELAAVTDVMGVRTNSDAVQDTDAGNLAAAKTEVHRVRLGVEGAWKGLKLGDVDLTPKLELGVRRDGGDAETGTGVDVGAGLAWSNPHTGFSATVQGRGLISHESDGFRDHGVSGSIGWDPRPGSERGLKFRLTHSAGAPATGGMDALLGRTTLEGLDLTDRSGNPARIELGLGYGVPAFDGQFTATPELGLRLSDNERRYRVGWRLGRATRDQGSMELGLDLTRTERRGDESTLHGAEIRLNARW